MSLSFACVFLAIVCGLTLRGDFPLAVLALYGGGSVTAFALYQLDKSAAIAGSRRTPEDTLLVVGLLGGWPGALAAQTILRHKSRKASFQILFWTTVVLNCAVLAWFWSANRG